ncbi:MFS transporter [Amycolatopsis sacchari]|uniref:MFS transporter n=1 Tax=Amycolatopsis sacchari TaxID=115433 RepID=UPI003EB9D44B
MIGMTAEPGQPGLPGAEGRPALPAAGLALLLLGAAMPMLDFFIVNVALSSIEADLHASTAVVEFVVVGYGIAYALLLVFGGRLGDAFGRRRLFLLGGASFTATSLACGLAANVIVLTAARVAQGAAGAMMFPQVLATIQATTIGKRRSRALAMYGVTAGLASVIGQLFGGILVSADIAGLGWRAVFLLNVPIGVVVLLARVVLLETRSAQALGFDGRGTGIFAIGVLALLVPLLVGPALGWPTWAWFLLAVVPFAARAFARVQGNLERAGRVVPLLPPSVLRMPSMRTGLAVVVLLFTARGGFIFVFAIVAQQGLALGARGSGMAFTPMAVGFLLISLVSHRLTERLGKHAVPLGAGVQAAGVLLLGGTVAMAWPNLGVLGLVPGMAVIGVGQGMQISVLFRTVLSQVPTDRAGIGSGVLATTQQASLALGVAVFGAVFGGLTDVLGMRPAFSLIMALQLIGCLTIVYAGSRLPDPRD